MKRDKNLFFRPGRRLSRFAGPASLTITLLGDPMRIFVDVLMFCAALIAVECLVGCQSSPKPTPAQIATTQAVADASAHTANTGAAIKQADSTLNTLPTITPEQQPVVETVHTDLATAATENGAAAIDLKAATTSLQTVANQAAKLQAANDKLTAQVKAYDNDWFGGKAHRLFWWVGGGLLAVLVIGGILTAIGDYADITTVSTLATSLLHIGTLGLGVILPELWSVVVWVASTIWAAISGLVKWVESQFHKTPATPAK